MMLLPAGMKVHLAMGYTDMRKGIDGLAMLVQGVLRQDPFSGHLFVFRGRKANLIKIVYWDGTGLCLFTKRLEHAQATSYLKRLTQPEQHLIFGNFDSAIFDDPLNTLEHTRIDHRFYGTLTANPLV